MPINEIVQTPNGPARLQAGFYLEGDDYQGEPSGVMVRHMPRVDIDPERCAQVLSSTNREGWLVVYKREEITG